MHERVHGHGHPGLAPDPGRDRRVGRLPPAGRGRRADARAGLRAVRRHGPGAAVGRELAAHVQPQLPRPQRTPEDHGLPVLAGRRGGLDAPRRDPRPARVRRPARAARDARAEAVRGRPCTSSRRRPRTRPSRSRSRAGRTSRRRPSTSRWRTRSRREIATVQPDDISTGDLAPDGVDRHVLPLEHPGHRRVHLPAPRPRVPQAHAGVGERLHRRRRQLRPGLVARARRAGAAAARREGRVRQVVRPHPPPQPGGPGHPRAHLQRRRRLRPRRGRARPGRCPTSGRSSSTAPTRSPSGSRTATSSRSPTTSRRRSARSCSRVASSTTSRSSAQPPDVAAARSRFPALASGAVFLDGPGGSQVPQEVVDAVDACLRESNANLGGAFATSAAADLVMDRGRAAAADFTGARAGRDRLRRQHDDAQLPARARGRAHARAGRRDRRHAPRPRRQRVALAADRAGPRPGHPPGADPGGRRHARPRRAGGADRRAHAGGGVHAGVERGGLAHRPGPHRGRGARRRRARLGGRGPPRPAPAPASPRAGASTCCSARPTSSSAPTSGWPRSAPSWPRRCRPTGCGRRPRHRPATVSSRAPSRTRPSPAWWRRSTTCARSATARWTSPSS